MLTAACYLIPQLLVGLLYILNVASSRFGLVRARVCCDLRWRVVSTDFKAKFELRFIVVVVLISPVGRMAGCVKLPLSFDFLE